MEIKYLIPMGYRFRPTEVELITYYLTNKTKGVLMPELKDQILERRLYGEDATPWIVLKDTDPWEDLDGSNDKKFIYVFSKLIPMNGKRKTVGRICRTAGCGTWDGKAVAQEIKKGGSVIGYKKSFTFKPKKELEEEISGRGHWIMYEYSLPPSGRVVEEYVICKIMKDGVGAHVEESSDSSSVSHLDGAEIVNEKRRILDTDRDEENDEVLKKKKKNEMGIGLCL